MGIKIIYEPMTLFTDLILGGLALYFGLKTGELYWQKFNLVHFHFSWAFYFLALGAFLGGLSHGFGPHFSPLWKDLIWKGTLLSVCLTTFFMLMASFVVSFPYKTYEVIRWIPVVALIVFSIIVWRDSRFINVIKFYVPAMIFVLIIMIYFYFVDKHLGAARVALGIIISFLGAGVQISGFSLHTHFNHNDLYHIIQIGGLWFIYRGAIELRDLP